MIRSRGARSPRRRAGGPTRLPVVLLLLGLLAGLLAGCSDDHADGSALGDRTSALKAATQHLLDQRARAIRHGDLKLFLHGLDRDNHRLVQRQRRYFRNLQQLPLAQFRYRVLDRSWSNLLANARWGKGVSMPQLLVTMQLGGYDVVPVTRLTGLAFAHRHGRLVVVGDRTRTGTFFPGAQPAPWEITRIRVRSSAGILGVYDEHSYADSGLVNAAVAEGVREVRSVLPFRWAGHVVVYEFSDKRVLASFDNVPGGNINHLGALTFPVYAHPGASRAASSRFVVMPGSVRAGQPFLGRITRHELTHVALARRDDGVPTWFAEGVAEYVGARDLAPTERRIATVAVARARAGVPGMPASATFNGADQDWNYALAWMACDWIAEHRGESRLWDLMNALHNGGRGTADDEQDGVLRSVIGLDSHQLAHRAAQRILDIYG